MDRRHDPASGGPDVPVSLWIIWPAIVWVLATAGYAWFVYGNKPVSEGEIKREIERQAGQRR